MSDKTFTKGETVYNLRLFPTMLGLKIQRKLAGLSEDNSPEPELFFEVISAGCSINSIAVTAKKFDDHFKGKYAELLELFYAILTYNFGSEGPNVDSGTDE